ncbi:hypothetical protein FJW08_31980 [Mesorhizobium sp. B3-2-1]|nr:hypothetical protein FJW08_31980 [Mesorhizobium sp. B3-2-1]
MIRAAGKKQKRVTEPVADREFTAEADYYARKFGLTRDEAQSILDEDGGLDFLGLQVVGRFPDRPID